MHLDQRKNEGLPKGYVAQSTFWLVDGDEFIGRSSLRHELTEHLLKYGGHIGYDIRPSRRGRGYGTRLLEPTLPEAHKLHIDQVLVTCNTDNLASIKVIEANGGVLRI